MKTGQKYRQQNISPTPEDWESLPLIDIAKLQGGYSFKSTDYTDEGIRLFRIMNVSFGNIDPKDIVFLPPSYYEDYQEFALKENDIIIALTRPITQGGIKAARIRKDHLPALLNQRVGRFQIRRTDKIVPNFLFYIIFSHRFVRLVNEKLGVTNQPNISPNDIEKFKIAFPPINEQERIVSILSKVDELIQKTDQIIEQTQRLKKGLMQKLLTKGIGDTRYKIGPTGMMPETWNVITLKEIVETYKNGIYKKSQYHGHGIPNVRMFNIKDGKIDTVDAPLIEVTEKEALDYGLTPGDILINRVNSADLVGKAGAVKEEIGKVVFDSMNIRLRINRNMCNPLYLSYFLLTSNYYAQIRSVIKSAVAQSSINQEDLDNIEVCLPPISEQEAIVSILSKIEKNIAIEIKRKDAIVSLNKGLMQKLLTGKIRFKI